MDPEDLMDQSSVNEQEQLAPGASKDPFVRSMTYWLLKEYARAAATLLDQVTLVHSVASPVDDDLPSHVFYFYSYLRTHPLVVRQRLAAEGIQVPCSWQGGMQAIVAFAGGRH